MHSTVRCIAAVLAGLVLALWAAAPAEAALSSAAPGEAAETQFTELTSSTVQAGPGLSWSESGSGWARSLAPGAYRGYTWSGKTPNVQQAWNYTCVPAAIQSELSLALGSFDASSSKQMEIYTWGRSHLGFPLPATERGLDPHAWAEGLKYYSGGKVAYEDGAWADPQAGLRELAGDMRRTGHPQGVAVHNGTHAWTLIGFTATADPAVTSRFTVTGVFVMAPYMSWTDPPTGTFYTSAQFISLWGTYAEPAGTTVWTGKYAGVAGG